MDVTAEKVAAHYTKRDNQTRDVREQSPIIHLKKLNNWVKSILIQIYTKENDVVFDMGCGKGGDLQKWDKARIAYYVGADITAKSVEDARSRYNAEDGKQRVSYQAHLICADCYSIPVEEALGEDIWFDVCSCQFSIHYAWEMETKARQAFENASCRLKPGGIFLGTMPDANVLVRKLRTSDGLQFGNPVYNVKFNDKFASKVFPADQCFGLEYNFTLLDAIDNCPEYLVPFDKFRELAAEYDLELELKANFHEFLREKANETRFAQLATRLNLSVHPDDSIVISDEEWDAAYLYMVFVFRKRGKRESQRQDRWKHGTHKPIPRENIVHLISPPGSS